ncbi:MAG TPA: hypothetical protein VFE15_02065 [Marmoricola sp.]|jgi:hypothetical protein|nr:hypothetical protein [Marmoricola sp.]
MGKHSGEPIEEDPGPGTPPLAPPAAPDRKLLGSLAAGITAAVVAWGFLVAQAIRFGSKGRDGETEAWFFLFLATLGATACMFVMLILGTKALAALRGEAQPRRVSGGGRRAR